HLLRPSRMIVELGEIQVRRALTVEIAVGDRCSQISFVHLRGFVEASMADERDARFVEDIVPKVRVVPGARLAIEPAREPFENALEPLLVSAGAAERAD